MADGEAEDSGLDISPADAARIGRMINAIRKSSAIQPATWLEEWGKPTVILGVMAILAGCGSWTVSEILAYNKSQYDQATNLDKVKAEDTAQIEKLKAENTSLTKQVNDEAAAAQTQIDAAKTLVSNLSTRVETMAQSILQSRDAQQDTNKEFRGKIDGVVSSINSLDKNVALIGERLDFQQNGPHDARPRSQNEIPNKVGTLLDPAQIKEAEAHTPAH